MQSLQLHMWQETMSLEAAFAKLVQMDMAHPVLKEMGKRLLYSRSFEEYKIEAPDQAKSEALLTAFCQRLKLKDVNELAVWLERHQQTHQALMQQLVYQERLNRLKEQVISKAMVEEAFLKQKARRDSVLFGLMRMSQKALAQEVYYRLVDDGQDFGLLAQQFSVGPEAKFGGIVGPKPIYEINPELRKVLATLKPGDTTEPFTLDENQYLIVRLFRAEQAVPNAVTMASLQDELFEQWTERQLMLANIRLAEQPLENGDGAKQEAWYP